MLCRVGMEPCKVPLPVTQLWVLAGLLLGRRSDLQESQLCIVDET